MGLFVQACTQWMIPTLFSREGEVLGLLHVITWMTNIGLNYVIFELDYKLVVDAVNNSGRIYQSLVSLLISIGIFFPLFQALKLIRRQTNLVAHALVRASTFFASSCIHDITPTCIANVIMNEVQ